MTQPEYEKRIEEMVEVALPCFGGYCYTDECTEHEFKCPGYRRSAVVAILLKQRREVLEEAAQHRYSHYANGWEMCMCGKKSNKWADHIITLGGSDDPARVREAD